MGIVAKLSSHVGFGPRILMACDQFRKVNQLFSANHFGILPSVSGNRHWSGNNAGVVDARRRPVPAEPPGASLPD